jgi:hypothetical protein
MRVVQETRYNIEVYVIYDGNKELGCYFSEYFAYLNKDRLLSTKPTTKTTRVIDYRRFNNVN